MGASTRKTPKQKIEREARKLKISFRVNGSGSTDARITLPISWVRDMKINGEEREVEVLYSPRTKKISIKKWSEEEPKEKE
ncbi:MAG: AbrB/MazE/SpoVT family DNA-binding domain-containing protein [Cetobacterium sp.]|uniref:AbrB/MazE/SpoVT family DNA-binding domain-containing protein n=1 Tax=Cetobacterium sp. TaxID=2071632 RepID=UPI003F3BAEAF